MDYNCEKSDVIIKRSFMNNGVTYLAYSTDVY